MIIQGIASLVVQVGMLPIRMTHAFLALMVILVMLMVPQMTLVVQVCIPFTIEEKNDP